MTTEKERFDDSFKTVASAEEGQGPVAQDADEALKFLRREEHGVEIDLVEERKLLKKIDRMVVPLMAGCYFLQFLDKSLLNYAAVMGIFQDTKIDTNKFATLSLLFYVAFLIFEPPHAYLLQRLPVAKYLASMVMLWGIVVACTSACNNYGSLVATRFLLGTFESAISPALILVTSMWYKRQEQPRRVGYWYIGVGCAVIFGSIMSFAFQHYHSKIFKSWQVMFLVIGLLTIFWGAIVFWFLPDNPMSSRLTHSEKIMAIERLRENKTGIENKHFKPQQAMECLRDPQVWLISIITIAGSIPNGAIGSFQSILIKSFGFNNRQSALLQIPSGVIAIASVLTATYIAGRFNARVLNIILWNAIGGVLGGCLLAFLPANAKAGKMVGLYFNNMVGAFLPCAYSLAAANFAGHTKKVTMNAILLMSFCLGNILGPLTFRNQDAPEYAPAKITIVAVDLTVIVTGIGLLAYYIWENKRRDRLVASSGGLARHQKDSEFADLTDRQNLELRYKY